MDSRPLSSGGFVFGLARLHRIPFATDRQRLLRGALEYGFHSFDVAPAYGNGLSEVELGKALSCDRSNIAIGTKFGIPIWLFGELSRHAFPLLKMVDRAATLVRGSPYCSRDFRVEIMRESLHGSLRRMKTDYVDRLFIHEPLEPLPSALLDDLREMASRLIDQGSIRQFGVAGPLRQIERQLNDRAFQIVQAPLADIERLPGVHSRPTISYGVYREFRREARDETLAQFIRRKSRALPRNLFLVSASTTEHLRSLGTMLQ